ncbi:ATP-binding cassette domain-containing protein [Streptomyces sp. NBC_00690]|uniref:ATP-binding cassette domain-containing protein n=1 Tax=Streptomyces sp. NBC_00690 TaxID=2975808 RepID=UPI002E2C84A9|nr:ATP-binding cassette domain-containing protein [Streptomyces sp. NBC_00690]
MTVPQLGRAALQATGDPGAAIEVRALRKAYPAPRRRRWGRQPTGQPAEALRGIDLTVPTGSIFGFLGPNGAGKTTTVRILATLLAPDSGSAVVAGHDVLSEPGEVRRRIGYVSQYGGVNPATRVRANLLLQARLFGLTAPQAAERADTMLRVFGLRGLDERRTGSLSGGQARRLALAVGLVHAPGLLFLDEPTLGLDPRARSGLWQEIRALRDRGSTVFLTSHYLHEADSLCDQLAIIDEGRVVVCGTPEELKKSLSPDVLRLRLESGHTDAVRVELTQLSGVHSVRADDSHLRVYTDDGEKALPLVLHTLNSMGCAVDQVALSRPSLDDVFLHHTGRSLTDGPGAAQ